MQTQSAAPTITTRTMAAAPPKIAKWCKAWDRKCRAAGLVGTMIGREIGRPSMGRKAYHLQLRLPGQQPATFSFKGAALDAIDEAALRNGTLALMKAVGMGRERETGERTPSGVPLMRFAPSFEV